jgi:hypothetical protein
MPSTTFVGRGSRAPRNAPLSLWTSLHDASTHSGPPRASVTPEDVWAARLARDAARASRCEAARMRHVVIGIWVVAAVLAATLGFFAMRS